MKAEIFISNSNACLKLVDENGNVERDFWIGSNYYKPIIEALQKALNMERSGQAETIELKPAFDKDHIDNADLDKSSFKLEKEGDVWTGKVFGSTGGYVDWIKVPPNVVKTLAEKYNKEIEVSGTKVKRERLPSSRISWNKIIGGE